MKFKSYGVKKPLETKQDKIQALHDQNKRYYPIDVKGNLDEWGAVIKRQAEGYERMKQEQQVQNQVKARHYG